MTKGKKSAGPAWPKRKDVLWVLDKAFGRHTRGFRGWWAQNALKMGPVEVTRAILTVYEAGYKA